MEKKNNKLTAYKNDYNKKNYRRVTLILKPHLYCAIKKKAKLHKVSVNSFIVVAVTAKLIDE